jgi:hypothetical protein
MYIGTFHSICLRIIKENREYSHITKNYRTLDDFDQKYTVMRHINEFRSIDNFSLVVPDNIGVWDQSEILCTYVNNLSEELVDIEVLKADSRPHITALSCIDFINQNILSDKVIYKDLLLWLKENALKHQSLKEETNYGYAGLLYQMFEYEPFKSFLDINISFSGVKDSIPTITIDPTKSEIAATITGFDHTVKNIRNKDFSKISASGQVCQNCDFRYYCKR